MKHFFTLFVLLLMAAGVSAQASHECRLSVYTVHDGLSQGRVTSLAQDHDGVLWIATWDGLNRFDGYKFTCYKAMPGNHEPLLQNRFDNIVINNENDIWCIGRDRFYLFRTGTQRFVDVHSMLEDKFNRRVLADKIEVLKNGFTWLVDEDGTLFRVEDKNIDNIEIFEPLRPGRRRIYDVRLDSRGNEWLLTDQGVIVNGDISFKSKRSYKSCIERHGSIWLGTPGGELAVYRLETGELSFIEDLPEEVQNLNRMSPINDSTLLMQTDAGVVFVDVNACRTELVKLPNGAGVSYCYNSGNSRCCLISHDRKLYRLDMRTHRVDPIALPDRTPNWSSADVSSPRFFKNKQGDLFFFMRESGLFRVDLDHLTMRPYEVGRFLSPSVRTIFQDRQKNVWVGCNVGLHKLQFGNGEVEPHPGYMKKEIRCLFSDSRDRMWVASRQGVVEIWEGDKRLGYLAPDGRIAGQPVSFGVGVYAIYEDHTHNLWLGTRGKGLYRLRYRSPGKYDITGHFMKDARDVYGISGDAVYAILQDYKGRLWVACYDSGLNLVENPLADTLTFLHADNRLGSQSRNIPEQVRCLAETSDSVILVGTTRGFYTFDENFSSPEDIIFYYSERQKDDANSLGSNDIMGIEVTRGGDIYLAVFGGGLNKVMTKNLLSDHIPFRPYMKRNGAYSDVAINLIEDRAGYLWVQTERGLMRFDPRKENFENVGYDMLPRYATLSENKPLIDDGGRLLVPTSLGVYVVTPEKLDANRYVPAIVFGEGVDSVLLKPEERTLSVPFAAVDFSSNLPVRYAYKLQGVDDEWTITQENLTANYVNLPAGTFYLRVKSTNRSGKWVDNERVLPITREPLFSETPWALALYLLLAVAFVAVIVFIYLHIYKLRYKLTLEHRLTEAKLRFFTDISHELRTPLTLIEEPLSEVLADEKLPEEDREYLTVVQTNAHRMLNLINQILDFRKIQNEKMRLLVEKLNVRESLETIMENFENMARMNRIDFRLEMGEGEVYVWADRDKFEKIFINIISNAFKYTPQDKSIVVRVTGGDNRVSIAVEDQGVGIQPSKIANLFQRFDTILQNNIYLQSTGIGLSLVKQLVDLHHAAIDVRSEEGKGSTFEVTFPTGKSHLEDDERTEFLMNDDMESDDASPSGEAEEPESDDRFSVLVVEDNNDLRSFLRNCLTRSYNVYTAANGEEGWQMTLEYMPDLVITDLMMPVVDGFELAERIKGNPTTCHIPIVVLTAKNTLDDRIRGANSGISEYMVKPFSTQLLKARVAMILQQQQIMREKYMESIEQKSAGEVDYQPTELSIMPADEQFMQQLMAYIEANIENPDLSVDDLAHEMALSRSVFFRKIKALVGYSPINFLQVIRIKRAIQLMQTRNFSVAEVAYKVGYTDPKYFSRSFKKITGKSPSTYLREE